MNLKQPADDKPLSIEQARGKIAKAMSDLLAGDYSGPDSFRLKPTKEPGETYPLKFTWHQRDSLIHYTRIKNRVKERQLLADLLDRGYLRVHRCRRRAYDTVADLGRIRLGTAGLRGAGTAGWRAAVSFLSFCFLPSPCSPSPEVFSFQMVKISKPFPSPFPSPPFVPAGPR